MKKRYYDFLSLALTGILYIFSIIRATIVPTRAPVPSWHMLLFAAGALVFYCLVNTRPGGFFFLGAIGTSLGYMAFLIFKNRISEVYKPVVDLINIMIKVGTGYYDDTVPFSTLMVAVGFYSLVVALPVYFFLVRCFRFYLAFTPGLVFYMVVWGLNRFVDKPSFFIFITIAVACYIRHVYLLNRKNGQGGETSYDGSMFVCFVPLAVVTVLLGAALPENPKPIEWPWLDNKIYDFWNDLEKKFTVDRYDTFSLAETGFGNPSHLGGPIYPDDTHVLTVKAPARVYLRGAVYDSYTGTGWVRTESNRTTEDRVYDLMELEYGWKAMANELEIVSDDQFNAYILDEKLPYVKLNPSLREYLEFLNGSNMPKVLKKLFPERSITVKHEKVRTKTLFTPLKMSGRVSGAASEIYKLSESTEGIFMSDRRLRGGMTYDVNYLQPAYGMKELDTYLNLSRPGLYWNYIRHLSWFIDKNKGFDEATKLKLEENLEKYEQLESYSEEIYRIYTGLPEGIPERVKELAKKITQYDATTYSKVKSLEEYLRSNYEYTLEPSYPPEDQDFTDYFLFDGKEGYCSYFASALCVMTRAVGIPSRYVEGFLLPEKSGGEDNYKVTNRNAHAWVEVYLEGVGWVTFEPTPPMADAGNYYVNLSDLRTSVESNVPDISEQYEPNRAAQAEERRGDIPAVTEKHSNDKKYILLLIFAPLLLIVILNCLFKFLWFIVINLISPEKGTVLLYRRAVAYLSQAGNAVQAGQTPLDFAKIIDEYYHFKCMSMSELTEIYYSVRFGLRKTDKKTLKRIRSFVSEVRKETGQNMYFFKKLLLRYILFSS